MTATAFASSATANACVLRRLAPLPLSMRKASLEKLLHRRPDGIFTGSFEQGEIGPDLFRKACEFGLEGLISKRVAPAVRKTGSR
jgi:bifunctional non-homologous end joining protein LigD